MIIVLTFGSCLRSRENYFKKLLSLPYHRLQLMSWVSSLLGKLIIFTLLKLDRQLLSYGPMEYLSDVIASRCTMDCFSPLTELEVMNLIKQSVHKSCPLDPMPTPVVVDYIDVLLPTIINASLTSGTFPEDWKESLVTPLLKKQNLDLVLDNYRRVSNLSFVSKLIFSHCVHLKLGHRFNALLKVCSDRDDIVPLM